MKNQMDTLELFSDNSVLEKNEALFGETTERLKRLDLNGELKRKILPLCRLKRGEIWEDSISGHKVGVLDAASGEEVKRIFGNKKARMVINDPPYNVAVGNANTSNLFKIRLEEYIGFSKKWVTNSVSIMNEDAHLYIWLGADYRDNFQPLPDFVILLRSFSELKPKNLITMRNQRGYGTQKNWMWVRQELLYYIKGNPKFNVEAEYTDIPKILRGYYKEVNKL